MSQEPSDEQQIRIRISPEPSDEEAAAIAAIVATVAASTAARREDVTAPAIDRWALAGRYESLRGPLWSAERER